MSVSRLLVIAGSDCSAGAGLQADLKTAQHFNVYAQTVVTAVTVQNTQGVRGGHLISPEMVRSQIEDCLSDIGADVIKIGMLGNGDIAAAVADALEGNAIPLVLDTVLMSGNGVPLLDEAGIDVLKSRLIARAMLVTPNLPECEMLTGVKPDGEPGFRAAAMAFKLLGCENVLLKGGHGKGDVLRDRLWSGGVFAEFTASRQHGPTHGTGCTLATAIACGLAKGAELTQAVADAHAYVQNAIRTAPGLGMGNGPLNHS